MAVYELHNRMVLPEYGNGTKKVQEFYLVEFVWDSYEGSFTKCIFSTDIVINDLQHLRNYIVFHNIVVACPNTEIGFDSKNLPKNKSLKHL